MASLAPYQGIAAAFGADRPARKVATDSETLAAFRVKADVNYHRSLSTLIESEIIPRLMIAHSADAPLLPLAVDDAASAEGRVGYAEVEGLAPLALQVEADELLGYIDAILARGVSVDTVMVDLLAPTARLLGEFWEDDRCDFVDVTMGLWRLQEIVHEIVGRTPHDGSPTAGACRALFASIPGDQHNFGVVIIDELFRRAGWMTERMSEVKAQDIIRRVGDQWFDIVGLTVSCDCHVVNLTSTIASLRSVSRNPRVSVMVGGWIFNNDPGLALRVGADGTARDAKLALKLAMDLIRISGMETAQCS